MALILSGTDGLSDIDGSASTPAIRGADTNTGIFFPAADTIAFSEGGVEAMRLDANGYMGIGTTSPAMPLNVVRNWVSGKSTVGAQTVTAFASGGISGFGNFDSDGSRAGYFYSDTNGSYLFNGKNTALIFGVNDTERMRIDTSGNVGIGTSSPGAGIRLDVLGGEIRAGRVDTSSEGGQVSFSRSSDNATAWYLDVFGNTSTPSFRVVDVSAGAVRATIDGSGRLTLPFQPAFHVRINNATYISTNPFPFTNVVFDVGSNFNTSTYRFTAPIAGRYMFLLSVYSRVDNNEDFYPYLRVNNGNRQYAAIYNNNTGGQIHTTCVATAIFNLSAGDFVDSFYAGNGDYYGGNQETNFIGYLLG